MTKRAAQGGEASVWWVYLLRCADGSLYTGISPDPDKRFAAHKAGKGAAYTRMHPPEALLAREAAGAYGDALRREAQLKRQPRARKLAWADNPGSLPPPREDADWLNRKRAKRRRRRAAKKKSPA